MAQHLFQSFEISENCGADDSQNAVQNAARVESLFARMAWDLEPMSRLNSQSIDGCEEFDDQVNLN